MISVGIKTTKNTYKINDIHKETGFFVKNIYDLEDGTTGLLLEELQQNGGAPSYCELVSKYDVQHKLRDIIKKTNNTLAAGSLTFTIEHPRCALDYENELKRTKDNIIQKMKLMFAELMTRIRSASRTIVAQDLNEMNDIMKQKIIDNGNTAEDLVIYDEATKILKKIMDDTASSAGISDDELISKIDEEIKKFDTNTLIKIDRPPFPGPPFPGPPFPGPFPGPSIVAGPGLIPGIIGRPDYERFSPISRIKVFSGYPAYPGYPALRGYSIDKKYLVEYKKIPYKDKISDEYINKLFTKKFDFLPSHKLKI
jgi:flagellin-specific chaperone FliS